MFRPCHWQYIMGVNNCIKWVTAWNNSRWQPDIGLRSVSPNSIMPTSPKLHRDTSWGNFREVGDLSRGSGRHGSCYGEVTGMFGGFKPSRHVQMVWKIPFTSRLPARLCQGNREIGDVHDKTRGSQQWCGKINGDVKDLSRTFRGCRTAQGSRHNEIWH